MDEHAKIPRTLIDKLFDLGVMGIEIPESYGGAGASFFHSVLAVEALSHVDPSIGVLVDVQNTLVINALLRWGSDEIKRRYLPKMATATIGAYALSEAGSGSDAFAMATRAAERDGDWVVNGRKLWITNGHEADSVHRLCQRQIPRQGIGASRHFSSSAARPASRSGRKKTSSGYAPAARANCCSRTAAFRAPTSSARSVRVTRSRSKR